MLSRQRTALGPLASQCLLHQMHQRQSDDARSAFLTARPLVPAAELQLPSRCRKLSAQLISHSVTTCSQVKVPHQLFCNHSDRKASCSLTT